MLAAGIQLATVLVIARWLGPDGNGKYAMSVLLPTFLSTLLNLGIPAANVYFIGRGDANTKEVLRSNVGYWIVFSLSGLVTSIVVVISFSELLFPDVPTTLIFLGLVAFPPALLQTYLASILQGLQDFRRFNTALLVGPVSSLLFVLAALILLDSDMLGALCAFIAGQTCALIATYALLRQSEKQHSPSARSSSSSYGRRSISYGWKAHLSNILAFLNYKVDIFLVNLLLDPAATGIYVIAVQLAERLWMLSAAVSTVIFPRLAKTYKSSSSQATTTIITSRWVLFLTTIGALFAATLASPITHILFGDDYLLAVDPLLFLLPGIVFLSVSRILANDIAARGKPEINMYLASATLTVNIFANLMLIPRLGVNGAALATTISYGFSAVARLVIFVRFSGSSWWYPLLLSKTDLQHARSIANSILHRR